MPQIFTGTSGFAYPTWKPDFYPEKLAQKKFLHYYATRLNAVEINYTFRRLPSTSTLEGWINETPSTFVFVLKAHQRITHFDRLETTEFAQVFFKSLDILRIQKRLGPVLFQLPPNLPIDLPRLEAFLAAKPEDIPSTFEFRNKSWLIEETYQLLEKYQTALCLAESEKLVVPQRLTANYVYFRLRKEAYSADELAAIASRVKEMLSDQKDVYVFFKHEDSPAGALCAEQLRQLCTQ